MRTIVFALSSGVWSCWPNAHNDHKSLSLMIRIAEWVGCTRLTWVGEDDFADDTSFDRDTPIMPGIITSTHASATPRGTPCLCIILLVSTSRKRIIIVRYGCVASQHLRDGAFYQTDISPVFPSPPALFKCEIIS